MSIINVRNLTSPRTGNPVANQFKITLPDCVLFQSYKTVICKVSNCGKVFLDRYSWDYSQTTGKYRNQFLNENKRETEKKIRSGEYKLIDLN